MTTSVRQETGRSCSFCGRPAAAVDKLIAGPAVYICDGCVRRSEHILTDDAAGSLEDLNSQGDDELLDSMVRLHQSREDIERAVSRYVRALRRRGVTWTRIGHALGISRQSAWERYSGEE